MNAELAVLRIDKTKLKKKEKKKKKNQTFLFNTPWTQRR